MSNRKFYSNFISLGLVQLTNFIVPILMYPYLFRTLGAANFGTMMYAFNIMLYLGAFIDYGFNISAPRLIAISQADIAVVSNITSAVLQTKLTLLLISVLFVVGLVIAVPQLQVEYKLYAFSLLYILGIALIPTWLFQGLEDMKHITWINLIAKIGVVFFILLFIHKPSDYIYVVGLFGVANIMSGIIGLFYAKYRYSIQFHLQLLSTVQSEIKNGWHYFTSSFASIAFSNSTLILLGLFVHSEILGKYSIAEKITFAVWQLIGVFSQVTYPMLCKLAIRSHEEVVAFIRKYYIPFILLILTISISIFTCADFVVFLATGTYQSDTIDLLRILSIFPFIVCLNVPAYQVLLAYEKQKYNALIFNYSAIISLCLSTLMIHYMGAIGAAWAAVLTQIGVTLSLHLLLRNRFATIALW